MRIVIDGRWIKQTGIGRYLEKTLVQILKIDQDNEYVLLVRSEDIQHIKFNANNLKLVKADYSWYGIGEQTKLVKQIKNLKPDLVHFTNFNVPFIYNGKFVVTIYDLTLLKFKNINNQKILPSLYHIKDLVMRRVLNHAIKKSAAIFTMTNFVKNEIVKKYQIDRKKITVTPGAADTMLKKITRVNLDKFGITKPFILYIGNAYPHKNLKKLILAFEKLVTDYSLDYQLVIVGKKDAFRKQLEREVHESGLEGRVIFTGFVPDDQLHYLYQSADIYSFPSLSEGFGLPALEAMSYDLPIASSNATCLPEVIGNGALYYDPSDTNNMAQVMQKLITDKKLQQKLVTEGKKQLKKFSWEKTAKKTLKTYQKS